MEWIIFIFIGGTVLLYLLWDRHEHKWTASRSGRRCCGICGRIVDGEYYDWRQMIISKEEADSLKSEARRNLHRGHVQVQERRYPPNQPKDDSSTTGSNG